MAGKKETAVEAYRRIRAENRAGAAPKPKAAPAKKAPPAKKSIFDIFRGRSEEIDRQSRGASRAKPKSSRRYT